MTTSDVQLPTRQSYLAEAPDIEWMQFQEQQLLPWPHTMLLQVLLAGHHANLHIVHTAIQVLEGHPDIEPGLAVLLILRDTKEMSSPDNACGMSGPFHVNLVNRSSTVDARYHRWGLQLLDKYKCLDMHCVSWR